MDRFLPCLIGFMCFLFSHYKKGEHEITNNPSFFFPMADNLITSHFDIIFLILSLLPAHTLIRVKTVCRAWAHVISDPLFIQKHCSLPAPISTLFNTTPSLFYSNQHRLILVGEDYKFPSYIAHIMSMDFVVVGHSSHGILCFSRNIIFNSGYNNLFGVGNPVTLSWRFVRYDPDIVPFSDAPVRWFTRDLVLIYDPAISHDFKLVIMSALTGSNRNYYMQFHIYSSDTCSWTISSRFNDNVQRVWEISLQPSKIGGGSVCWIERPGVLVGYEICADTCWKTTLPLRSRGHRPLNITSINNIIYCTLIDDSVVKVIRLEGKDSWVSEGACTTYHIGQSKYHPYAYDDARRALLIADTTNDNLLALHLSSLRLEILSRRVQFPMPTWHYNPIAHGNSLVPLRDAEK